MARIDKNKLGLVMAAALGAMVLAGCPCKTASPRNAGDVCGCPCCKDGKGCCKGKRGGHRRGRGFHGKHAWKQMARMKRAKKLMKLARMGAPKMLCPKKLIHTAKRLGLTADQVKQLEALKKSAQAGRADRRLAMKQAVHALKGEWLKDKPDGQAVAQATDKLTAMLQARAKVRMAMLLKVQKILTPMQWKKVRVMGGMMGHRGKGCKGKGCKGKGCKGCPGCKGCKGKGCKGKGCKGCPGCKGCKGKGCKGKDRPCRHKGPCTADCKRRGRLGMGRWHKWSRKGRMMSKMIRLGAPKLLCPYMLSKHAKMLGLGADQVAKLKAMKAKAMAGMLDGKLTSKRTMLQLKLGWLADTPDAAKLGTLGAGLWTNIAAMLKAKAQMLVTLVGLLTADQWKKLRTMKRPCMGRPCKGRRGRPCRGPHGRPCKAGANKTL